MLDLWCYSVFYAVSQCFTVFNAVLCVRVCLFICVC